MMIDLKYRLWEVANEYAARVGVIIDCAPEYWVAEEISVSSCAFNDTWFLTLEEMQIIVDGLPRWVDKYGSEKAVGEVVRQWLDYTSDTMPEYINLHHWLMGKRPEKAREMKDEK